MMAANLSVEVLLSIIVFLLGIIAFFMQRLVAKIDRTAQLTEKLEIAYSAQTATCTERHKIIDEQMKKHDEMVTDHETRISVLENEKN